MTHDRLPAMMGFSYERKVRLFTVAVGANVARSPSRQASLHPAENRSYQGLKKKVESAERYLCRALERPRSSNVRRAYVDLDQAIGRALAFVEGRVRLPYRGLLPPPTVNLDPFTAAAWHRELERLRDAREYLRFMALDDPNYGIPAVQVANRDATKPDLPGLRAGDQGADPISGHGMGIDLDAVVDEVSDHSRPRFTPWRRLFPRPRRKPAGQRLH
jgi:hypothetical protein